MMLMAEGSLLWAPAYSLASSLELAALGVDAHQNTGDDQRPSDKRI